MKKTVLAFLTAIAYGSVASAAYVNTGVLNVVAIKANTYAQEKSDTIYYYTFTGDFGESPCRQAFAPKSGDQNINAVLNAAYMMGVSVMVGIPSNCIITTVELQ
jgi:hypothetical protein